MLRLTAPNPGLMTGPGTNTYLVGRGEMVVVDPGPGRRVAYGGHRRGGGATRVRSAPSWSPTPTSTTRRAPPPWPPRRAHASSATGRPRASSPTSASARGGRCRCPGARTSPGVPARRLTLRALHTPGHASDHLCWLVEEHALLCTGDHVMHGSTVVIRPPDGDLHQYLDSLARVRDADPPIRTLAPGHGRLMDHVGAEVDALIAHRLGRHERVADALAARGEGDRRRVAARRLRRRHRAPAAGGALLAVGASAGARPTKAGPRRSTRRRARTPSRAAG